MARIPDEVITRLKSEISLQRLAEAQGITLRKHGQDLIGLCPFHDDKEPSLVITPKKNLWHCLGACQSGGSVIDWVMKAEGVSFRHAVELLQNDYCFSGSPPARGQALEAKSVKRSTVKKLDTPLLTDGEDQQLLNRVTDYYHACLKQSPEALAYLQERGITNNETIGHFKLGFANRTLGYRLPAKNRKPGVAIREQLKKIGLYRKSGHEHFTGSLIIPVFDEHNNVTEIYGRKINRETKLRKGTPIHLYLPGPHQGIWNSKILKASKEIILCESLIDALTFWSNGYCNVTASYGIEGFTKEHLSMFKQYEIERVLIAYDRDKAGEDAASKLSKQLIKEGIDCYRLQFPKGMDANEYALSVQPASKSLGVVIRSAVWMGAGKKKSVTTESIKEDATKACPCADGELVNETSSSPGTGSRTSLAVELETVVNEVLPASPHPEAPKADIETETKDNETIINLDDRRYRIRGLQKNLSYDVMKMNLLVSRNEHIHIDTFDLYQSRPRTTFIKQAAIELGVSEDIIKTDIGKLLLKLEMLQDKNIKDELEDKQPSPVAAMTKEDAEQALTLLKSSDLLERIVNDFNRCGIVGETINTLVGYLASVSRKLDNPLAIIIQSTSAAGKSSLMDAVLRFIPEEDKSQYSAMTGQSLFYMGETDLKHKVLAIVEEEGASQATYALKLLQSEGQLTIASTSKDPETGKLVTQEYKVEGPVMIFLTTTAIEVDEELMNRCLVLTVNEDREQTQAIHQLQRKKRTLDGLIAKSKQQSLLTIHQNAQRLLKPLAVVNPYAEHLTFLNDQTRTRRDHEKYLTLIDAIALLHQYQREVKHFKQGDKTIEYIEVTINDIEAANTLAHEVLGRTLDELPPQTRKLLTIIDKLVTNQCNTRSLSRTDTHFSRREIREYSQWGNTQLGVHLDRLVKMEYLLIHRGGRGQSFVYELVYDGCSDEQPHLNGLIDVEQLKNNTTMQSVRGNTPNPTGSKRPQNGGSTAPKRSQDIKQKSNTNKASSELDNELPENTYIGGNGSDASYTQSPSLVAASK